MGYLEVSYSKSKFTPETGLHFKFFTMIQIKEFRVGNYVLVDNTVRRICLINNDPAEQSPFIGYEGDEECMTESCNSERLGAISLTDDLLKEFGFIFHEHFRLWQHVKPDHSYSIELDRDYSAMDFGHRPIVKNIQHLHVLQNLFYTIQGRELIK